MRRIAVRDLLLFIGFSVPLWIVLLIATGEATFTPDLWYCLIPPAIMVLIGLVMYSRYSKAVRGDNSLMWSKLLLFAVIDVIIFLAIYLFG